MINAHIIFHGRVQGVGFRWFVEKTAVKLGLSGTVKNLRDGTVEAWIEGNRLQIEHFIENLKLGNGFSRIDDVKLRFNPSLNNYNNFRIITD